MLFPSPEVGVRLGIVFPQIEIGRDPAVIRDFAQAAEGMGYEHLLIADHVLGADTAHRPGWRGYTVLDAFHEPFVLYGYLASCTERLGLATCILILPQRQTALVAKQAAQVDVLSGGRLRLGVGIGWNPVEYEALGVDFKTRGARVRESLEVMRALWTTPCVTYRGRWHTIVEAGVNPLPVQRPIPIWMGGDTDVALRRAARLADGWMPGMASYSPPLATAESRRELVARLRRYVGEAGRRPEDVGIEARVAIAEGRPEAWRRAVLEWRRLGATHLSVLTSGAGLRTPRDHVDAARQFRDAVGGMA